VSEAVIAVCINLISVCIMHFTETKDNFIFLSTGAGGRFQKCCGNVSVTADEAWD